MARVGMGFLMGVVTTLLSNNVAVLIRSPPIDGAASVPTTAKHYTDDDDGGSIEHIVLPDLVATSAAGSNQTVHITGYATSQGHTMHISSAFRDLPFSGSSASKVHQAVDKVRGIDVSKMNGVRARCE